MSSAPRSRPARRPASLTASAAYGYIRDVPTAGITKQSFVNAQASVQIADRWRLFGSAVYDFATSTVSQDSVGFAYDDSCVSLSIAYTESREYADPRPFADFPAPPPYSCRGNRQRQRVVPRRRTD